jgi:hypothetical protein
MNSEDKVRGKRLFTSEAQRHKYLLLLKWQYRMKFILGIISTKIPPLTVTLKITPVIVIITTSTFLMQYRIISALGSITDPTCFLLHSLFLSQSMYLHKSVASTSYPRKINDIASNNLQKSLNCRLRISVVSTVCYSNL